MYNNYKKNNSRAPKCFKNHDGAWKKKYKRDTNQRNSNYSLRIAYFYLVFANKKPISLEDNPRSLIFSLLLFL